MNLTTLANQIKKCKKCPLYKSRKKAVPGEGPKKAKIMFIGEAPGAEEDKVGKPFVGRSGRFFDQLLKKNKINRKKVFITGAVKCHPPKNRNPKLKELKICKKLYLDKQIKTIKPKLIVILGRIALKSLLNQNKIKHGKRIKNYFITYHPAAAMRFPKIKKAMEKDFKKIKKEK